MIWRLYVYRRSIIAMLCLLVAADMAVSNAVGAGYVFSALVASSLTLMLTP